MTRREWRRRFGCGVVAEEEADEFGAFDDGTVKLPSRYWRRW